MSFLQWGLAKEKAIKPAQTLVRSLDVENGAATNTAETISVDLPRDHFINTIIIALGYDTNATADNVANLGDLQNISAEGDIEVVLNGSQYPVKMTGDMCKAVSIMNKLNQATGYYRIDFLDPRIPNSKGLPAWLFSSARLRIDTPAVTSDYAHVGVTLLEEFYQGEDISNIPLLVQKYMVEETQAGTSTGTFKYEHERVHTVYGYVYEFTDGDTLEDPAKDGFDNIYIVGRHPAGEDRIMDTTNLVALKELNKQMYQQALPTGIVAVDFPNGYPTGKYSSIYTYYHIDTAASTSGNLKVLERYVLGG